MAELPSATRRTDRNASHNHHPLLRRTAEPRKDDPPGGLAPRTVRYIHTIIHAARRDALRWNRVIRSVADAATPPSAAAARSHRPKAWTAEQLRTFLDFAAESPYLPAWIFSLPAAAGGASASAAERVANLIHGSCTTARTTPASTFAPPTSDPAKAQPRRGERPISQSASASAPSDRAASGPACRLLPNRAPGQSGPRRVSSAAATGPVSSSSSGPACTARKRRPVTASGTMRTKYGFGARCHGNSCRS